MKDCLDVQPLLRVKHVIDTLKTIDPATLTERERYAYKDSLKQAYDRAAFLLAPVISKENRAREVRR